LKEKGEKNGQEEIAGRVNAEVREGREWKRDGGCTFWRPKREDLFLKTWDKTLILEERWRCGYHPANLVMTASSLLTHPTVNFMLAIYTLLECRPTFVFLSGFTVQTKTKNLHFIVQHQLKYIRPTAVTQYPR
jgi:hypothetical protein